MSKENIEITTSFIRTWRVNPDSPRLTPEFVSLFNETHRLPDTYFLGSSSEGKLLDPETGRPVEEFIDKTSYLGRNEYGLFEKLQNWFAEVDEGEVVWISPSYPERYPCTKAIFHQIAYKPTGEKVLLCSAVLLDISTSKLTEIVSWLGDEETKNIEEIRTKLFFIDEKKQMQLLGLLQSNQGQEAKSQDVNQVIYFTNLVKSEIPAYQIAAEMAQKGFLGSFPISCPSTNNLPTLSEFLAGKTWVEGVKFVKKCGNCGAQINAHICKGFRCASCGGVYEGC